MGRKSREKAERRNTPVPPPRTLYTVRSLDYGGHLDAALPDLVKLRRAVEQQQQLQLDIAGYVKRLRGAGASWAVIGDALGITRQSAQTRFGGN